MLSGVTASCPKGMSSCPTARSESSSWFRQGILFGSINKEEDADTGQCNIGLGFLVEPDSSFEVRSRQNWYQIFRSGNSRSGECSGRYIRCIYNVRLGHKKAPVRVLTEKETYKQYPYIIDIIGASIVEM